MASAWQPLGDCALPGMDVCHTQPVRSLVLEIVWPVSRCHHNLTADGDQRLISDNKCRLAPVHHEDFNVRMNVQLRAVSRRQIDEEKRYSDAAMIGAFEEPSAHGVYGVRFEDLDLRYLVLFGISTIV